MGGLKTAEQLRATSPSGVVLGAPEPQYRMMLTSTVSHGFGRGEKYGKFADCGIATLIYVVLSFCEASQGFRLYNERLRDSQISQVYAHAELCDFSILPYAKYLPLWGYVMM